MASLDGFPYGVGLDLSSSSLAAAREDGDGLNISNSVHAFVEVPNANDDVFSGIPLIASEGKQYAFGREAVYVGLQASSSLLKADDIITPSSDPYPPRAVSSLSASFLVKPRTEDEYIYFSAPTQPLDTDCVDFSPSALATYHTAFYLRELARRGYRPLPCCEGHAIVLAEAATTKYTGVGISFGMAFINAAVVKEKRLLRVVTQTKAGTWVINQTALELGISTDKVMKALKTFDPTDIRTDIDLTLRFYYRQCMDEMLDHLDSSFLSLRVPASEKWEMIWAGPMTSVKSFPDLARERFNMRSLERTFSASISGQRRGKTPESTVVSGLCLRAKGEYSGQ
jgi:hypothetical protein